MRGRGQFILPMLVGVILMEPQSSFGSFPFINKIVTRMSVIVADLPRENVEVRNLYFGNSSMILSKNVLFS